MILCKVSADNLQTGREILSARCASCHGIDGSGTTPIGRSLSPRVPDLRSRETQSLSDGEIHYIIENGVQLTGMPAWGNPHQQTDDLWRLVIFIRDLRPHTKAEQSQQTGSQFSALRRIPRLREVSRRYLRPLEKTPMANIVRDPRQHPTQSFLILRRTCGEILPRAGRLRLRKPLEAALLHQSRRRLLPTARAVGNQKSCVE